jgi:hypothetical protein
MRTETFVENIDHYRIHDAFCSRHFHVVLVIKNGSSEPCHAALPQQKGRKKDYR